MNKLLVIVIAFFTINSNAQLIDTNFTNPKCAAYGDKPRNAFCTRADLPNAQKNPSGPYQKVLNVIKNKGNRHITLGTMTFSHKDVAAALCQSVKNGVGVTVLIDAGAEMATADMVASCGGEVVKVGTAETEEARGDLHHNKFIIAEGSDETTVVFATANFSNPGLTINHESWTIVKDSNDSVFVQNHKCLVEAVKTYQGEMNRFKQSLSKCRETRNQGKIESLFVPADSTRLVSIIEQGFKKSSRVLLTSNRYSFDRITKAYRSSPSKDSRALFDDDLYWGGIQPTDEYPTEKVDAVKVAQLEKAGVKVKFMQTSFGAAQKMHSKFIVFDDFVVVGAGNYTASGMMSNFENFYVIRDAKVVEEFRAQFEYLWSIGSFRSQMPKDYTDPGKRN
jgi:phosphatidylserine/phosphatidylglycerophosphate/cardiolipin synthase-like enzyme